ncbi:MAG TPA: LysR family transcriptional regulator [Acidimicrobiia bacterium]|nr:LysR family transcriptional regulator [Acidimicrobiia bacterium]
MRDLEPRLLRSFLAVADELHFTRAAASLFLAQQVVSRHITDLERRLGVELFERSTRQVALTPAGERFVPHARRMLQAQAEAFGAVRSDAGALVVDVIGDGLTAARLVATARASDPEAQLVVRRSGGVGAAVTALAEGRRDVVFGRVRADRSLSDPVLVRYEPLALLLPPRHPWCDLTEVPGRLLAGEVVDISLGNESAPEWTSLAEDYLAAVGAEPTPPHPTVEGPDETALHLVETGVPILTMSDAPPVPSGEVRPLVDPVPVYTWSMVHRRGWRHPSVSLLLEAADELAGAEGWRRLPGDAWLPAEDRRAVPS